MKLKHTPGPWKFSQGFIGARHCMFVSCNPVIYDGMHIHNGEKKGEATEESKANARLIACAPDLLNGHIDIEKIIKGVDIGNLLPEVAIRMIKIISDTRIESATGLSIEEVLSE